MSFYSDNLWLKIWNGIFLLQKKHPSAVIPGRAGVPGRDGAGAVPFTMVIQRGTEFRNVAYYVTGKSRKSW